MNTGLKILRQYYAKINRSKAALQGFRSKAADKQRVTNYLIGATLGLVVPISFIGSLPKSKSLVNLLWAVPVATTIGAIRSRKSMEGYEREAWKENNALDIYQCAYDAERKTILDSVRSGSDKCLADLSACSDEGFISQDQMKMVLREHTASKAIECIQRVRMDYRSADLEQLRKFINSGIIDQEDAHLVIMEGQRRYKREADLYSSSDDDPRDGYDGWL